MIRRPSPAGGGGAEDSFKVDEGHAAKHETATLIPQSCLDSDQFSASARVMAMPEPGNIQGEQPPVVRLPEHPQPLFTTAPKIYP